MGAFDDLVAAPPRSQTGHSGAFDDLLAAPSGPAAQPISWHMPTAAEAGAFGSGAADAVSLGFGDELSGALAGAAGVLSGHDYAVTYRQRVDEARARLEQARREHPLYTTAGAIGGTAATLLLPGLGEAAGARLGIGGLEAAGAGARAALAGRYLPYGRALLTAAEGRGAGALAAQTALGAGQGAVFGGLYGAGAADSGDRLGGATQGALWGAGLGAAGPAVFQGLGRVGQGLWRSPVARTLAGSAVGGAVGYSRGDTEADRERNALAGAAFGAGLGYASRPALAAVRDAWRSPRQFASQTGMSLGVPMGAQAGGGNGPQVPQNVVRGIDRLLGRQRYGVDEFESRINAAQAEPLGRTMADVGGEQFLAKTDALANLPGETGPQARAIAEQRARELPTQITDELQQRLGVAHTPTEALESLRNEYRQVSRDLYQPLLQRDVSPEAMQRLQPIIDRLPQAIRSRAERITGELAAMDGLQPNQLTGAQRIHYMKMALDDAIQGAERAEGLGAAQRAGLQRLKGEFLRVVEGDPATNTPPLIPGYREARMRWGGLKDAEDAMDAGRRAVNQRPQEVRAQMAQMTPFEREHFRIAAADELIRKVQRGSAAVGQRNAANPLNSNEIQGVVREIFDNPQEADAFLRVLNERNQLLRNASGWIGNSATMRRAAQAGDQFMDVAAGAAGHAAGGNALGVAAHFGRAGLNALRGMAFERENNALGSALLRNVEGATPEDAQYVRALIAQLRRLEQERIARGLDAGQQGAIGSLGGGSYADQGYGQ